MLVSSLVPAVTTFYFRGEHIISLPSHPPFGTGQVTQRALVGLGKPGAAPLGLGLRSVHMLRNQIHASLQGSPGPRTERLCEVLGDGDGAALPLQALALGCLPLCFPGPRGPGAPFRSWEGRICSLDVTLLPDTQGSVQRRLQAARQEGPHGQDPHARGWGTSPPQVCLEDVQD